MNQYPADLFRMSCGATAPLELKVSSSGRSDGERRIFEQPFVLVGRDDRSGIRFDDAAISRRHAYLQQLGERIFCIDLGSRTGIRSGGRPCQTCWLGPDRRVDIGPFTLEFQAVPWSGGIAGDEVSDDSDPLQDRVNDSRSLPRITVEMGNRVLSRFRMNRRLALVGSSPTCRVRLRDGAVSRFHCSFVKTPEGVWMIDLLSSTGTCLNGDPVHWTLVKEGDRLQVGPYVLRVCYEVLGRKTASTRFSAFRATTPVQLAADTTESLHEAFPDQSCLEPDKQIVNSLPSLSPEIPPLPNGLSMKSGIVRAQSLAIARPETYWPEVPDPVQSLEEELHLDRERKREAEVFRQQLADSQAECDRLRDLVGELEIQVTELAALQARLEAAEATAQELEIVRAERDRWQIEAKDLQNRIASDLAERHELQQQHAGEREAVRALSVRLEEASASVQELRADLTARKAEFAETLQRLQETQEELARSQEGARCLRAELDQAQESQRHTEELRQQLADAQAKGAAETENLRAGSVRLQEQVRVLEIQVAEMSSLQVRLEAAEEKAYELEIVRAERDRWQSEAQDLQARIVSDLHAAQTERDRLQTEHQVSRQSAEQAKARVSELERALADAAAAHERAVAELCARRERERQALATETGRLRRQLRTAESQVAEVARLQARLEAAEANTRQLEVVRAERDRWQTEAQALQDRIISDKAEQEELRQRLEAAQQQLAEEREAVQTASVRLDQESAILQKLRADVAIRNTEFDSAVQRLQETQEALARSQKEAQNLHVKMEQAQERERDSETRMQQLADAQTKLDQYSARVRELEGQLSSANRLLERLRTADAESQRLREQLGNAESQAGAVAKLQARLEAAEAQACELEIVRAERDRWQSEAQALQARIASDLHAVQTERDRLHTEHQASRQSAEQAKARVSELERALTDAAAAHERAVAEVCTRWERERQALEARLERERQTLDAAIQNAVRDVQVRSEAEIREVQARAASEREDLRQRLKGAEAQTVWERGLFGEQSEQLRRQVASLQQERETLAARLTQAELTHRAAEERSQEKAARVAELKHPRQPSVGDQEFEGGDSTRNGAAAEREQLAPIPNSQSGVEEPRYEVRPEADTIIAVERKSTSATLPAVSANAGASSPPSDTPRAATTPAAGEHPVENIHDWLLQHKGEERPGLWQRILNFIASR